jgi:hypothetical protein
MEGFKSLPSVYKAGSRMVTLGTTRSASCTSGIGIEIAPVWWLLLTLGGSCCEDHAALEEIKTCTAVASALDQLEPVDLAFGLTGSPGLGQSSSIAAA